MKAKLSSSVDTQSLFKGSGQKEKIANGRLRNLMSEFKPEICYDCGKLDPFLTCHCKEVVSTAFTKNAVRDARMAETKENDIEP